MTPLELGFLLAATALNLVTYWWANMVSIPNLGLWQAAVNNQTSTSVANTMPGGGYISIAVSYEMYRSWGFSSTDVGLSVAVTSVLNIFAKLALPAIALVLIMLSGRASGSLVGASVVGVLVLGRSGRAVRSRHVEEALRACDRVRARPGGDVDVATGPALPDVRLGRRRGPVPPHHDRLPRRTLVLARRAPRSSATCRCTWCCYSRCASSASRTTRSRGRRYSASSRSGGSSQRCRSRQAGSESSRSPTSAGLILAGEGHATVPADVFHAQVAAAVLVFRALTFGIQIPLGALTYLIWRTNTSWRRPPTVVAVGAPPRSLLGR